MTALLHLRLNITGPPVEVQVWAAHMYARWVFAGDPRWWLLGPPAWIQLSALLNHHIHPDDVYYVMDLRAPREESRGIHLCRANPMQLVGMPFPDVTTAIAAYAFGYRL